MKEEIIKGIGISFGIVAALGGLAAMVGLVSILIAFPFGVTTAFSGGLTLIGYGVAAYIGGLVGGRIAFHSL